MNETQELKLNTKKRLLESAAKRLKMAINVIDDEELRLELIQAVEDWLISNSLYNEERDRITLENIKLHI